MQTFFVFAALLFACTVRAQTMPQSVNDRSGAKRLETVPAKPTTPEAAKTSETVTHAPGAAVKPAAAQPRLRLLKKKAPMPLQRSVEPAMVPGRPAPAPNDNK
ncbi:MAG: hypothetical protein RMK52_07820 [Chitinophagales bacterium]|nr:hypothetical protein [Chitinophagales bacterium]MDW8394136.1 hypothetical protein [Chitinophagales bacterium]